MASIAIVHGGAAQRGGTRSACDQYTADHFQTCREYAEATCDSWVIVSAKHGVIHPNRQIQSYDVTRADFDPFEEMQWVKRIQRQLGDVLFDQYTSPQFSRVVVLTDDYHTAALDPVFKQATGRGVAVEKPFEGRYDEPVESVLKQPVPR
ncbi:MULTISPECIES: DUF6884 domain-containing protein [unclassified Haladaptatus]|uniref:DUF6884 domain-containing protein n=1 Tax=unclassified Haladaptatus TaxID=2622732 RepID=UPI0023E8CD4E|nr:MULTISPECIES: DUF6884 domain-containing protein [unclassified Haladaptatus]